MSRAVVASALTKRAIADQTGIPYPTLNRKLAGASPFTLSELLLIAEATGVRPSQFVPPFPLTRPSPSPVR